MTKESTIRSIKARIIAEHSKHSNLDWMEITARKLYSGIIQDLQRDAFEAGREGHIEVIGATYYKTFEDYLKEINE
jgi:hypothetical protein